MNTLTQMREDVKAALATAGIETSEYVAEALFPPVAVVLPGDPYVSLPVGQNPLKKPYSVNMRVLLISDQGTNADNATQIDLMLCKAIEALEDDWDIAEASDPQMVALQGINYMGAVIALTTNTEMEVI